MGSTKIESPAPPAQPSTADAINAWVASMPQVYETQMRYAPLQAQQQVSLAQQYALPYGEALQTAQEAMYPGTTALQEKLANQAIAGMDSEVPDWMRNEYLSNLNANMGTNVGAPIAADYVSRGLLQQKQDWQNYYRDLGLSLTGRQPLTQAQTPATSDYMSNYSPTSVMGYTSNNYGTYSGLYGSMYNANANVAAQGNPYFNAVAGIAGMGLGGWMSKP